MRIAQLSTFDVAGGAEAIARQLHESYRAHGHASTLLVGQKRSSDGDVVEIPNRRYQNAWYRGISRLKTALPDGSRGWSPSGLLQRVLTALRDPYAGFCLLSGREPMWSPASYQLCALTAQPPEILHGHNLHGLYGYFDLGALPLLARQLPVVLTLHDAWLVSGHCAHSLGCERWRTGCGRCPDLTLHPPLLRDGTARNWLCKAAIFARCQLYVATPSRGLMEQVERSLLAPALAGTRVIPNGVDTATFCPADPRAARRELNLRDDADIVLFAANGIRRNPWKDYRTLWAVLERLGARRQKPLLLLALGETAPAQRQGNAELRFLPFEADARVVARYFQAADVYLHCTRADTFPTTVLEALACGTPVVAAGVGGIPEQILEGQTGCLTAARDAEGMAAHVERLLSDRRLRDSMSRAARSCAEQRFGRDRMVRDYLDWYAEILASRRLRPAANEGQGKCASRL